MQTEGTVSVLTLMVLIPILALVYFGKMTTLDLPDGKKQDQGTAVFINDKDTTAESLAKALHIPQADANRIMEARSKRRSGFESVEQLLILSQKSARKATGGDSHQTSTTPTSIPPQAGGDSVHPPQTGTDSPLRLRGGAGGGVSSESLTPATIRAVQKRVFVRHPDDVTRTFGLTSAFLILSIFFVPVLLRRALRVDGDPFLLPLMLLLSGMGTAMLFSIKDPLRGPPAYLHHAQGLFLALIAFIFFAKIAPPARQKIRRLQYIWVLASLLLGALLFLFGHGPEGVKLNLFGSFQPVEAIKIMLVCFIAGYLAERAGLIADASRPFRPATESDKTEASGSRSTPRLPSRLSFRPSFVKQALPRWQDMAPVGLMFALALVLFYIVKDMGPGLLMFATFVTVLYLTTGRASFLLLGVLLVIFGGFLGYARHVGVFATRVDMWLHPFANSHPNGMQLAQGYWGVASGGWEGTGLGLGMPHLIPRGQDDLAFMSWGEETGYAGSMLVLVILACLIWRGTRIALRATSDFDRALAFGLTALFGLGSVLILCGGTGVLPLTGIALPFLSFGNSALVADAILLGLLRGISATPIPRDEKLKLEPTREVRMATRNFAFGMILILFGIIGFWRLGELQLWRANAVALQHVSTPDRDKEVRPHMNPRLLMLANAIPRGSIYDRVGRVVATSRRDEIAKIVPGRADSLMDAHARLYPYGPALAHLVGYIDPAVPGPYGKIERGYQNELRGYTQLSELLDDYHHRNMPGYRPRKGHDLTLTIDANLQQLAQQTLAKRTKRLKDRLKDKTTGNVKDRAAFVLVNPVNGDILVAASYPSFDPNTLTPERYQKLVKGPEAEQEHPLIDRALGGYYPPGSTMKIATAACALDTLPNAINFPVVCNGTTRIRWRAGGKDYAVRNIHDDEGETFGSAPITMRYAFVKSSNIYFANLAAALPSETFHNLLTDRMGFSKVPKQSFFDADLPQIGFGQGRMLASPLEMARLAACVGNGGIMYQKRLVARIVDPAKDQQDKTRTQEIPPAPVSKEPAMRPETAASLREMMHEVTVSGTAAGLFSDLQYAVGGKTGTAQNVQFDRAPHSWFVGFAPYTEGSNPAPPRYAFACIVENGGYGAKAAGPICAEILKALF